MRNSLALLTATGIAGLAANVVLAAPVTYTMETSISGSLAPSAICNPCSGSQQSIVDLPVKITATADTNNIALNPAQGAFVVTPTEVRVEFLGMTYYVNPSAHPFVSIDFGGNQYFGFVTPVGGWPSILGLMPETVPGTPNFALDTNFYTASASGYNNTELHTLYTNPQLTPENAVDAFVFYGLPAQVSFRIEVTNLFGNMAGTAKKSVSGRQAELEFAARLSLGAGNNGLNPATEAFKFTIGSYTLDVPAGGLRPSNSGGWKYSAKLANGIEREVSLSTRDNITYKLEVEAHEPAAALASIASGSTAAVSVKIGNDAGSTSVVVQR